MVKNFAEKIARTLRIPISNDLVKTSPTEAQKIFQSAISKKDNVSGKFIIHDPGFLVGKKVILIDDIIDSGYTIKEIALYLSRIGVLKIVPLVIAKTVGGDI
ncbi:MAG: phosphoribosyltransferase family protein [Cyclobacteriaceae bacterium]